MAVVRFMEAAGTPLTPGAIIEPIGGSMLFTARSAATFINQVYGVPGGVDARYVIAAIHEGDLIARMRLERAGRKGMYKIHPAELRDWCRKEFPRAAPVLDALLADETPNAKFGFARLDQHL